ncbi:MAG: hypothetical protein KatS3mg008_2239 [Acidimicrobiales bacterium]|nr:MAG: hypothetical protein KatS3mg008_2239 [Acidimicrobiales bacterium]
MATRSGAKRSSPARSGGSGRGDPTRVVSAKAGASEFSSPLLGDHAADVVGVVLATLGVLTGLAFYAELAGPAGELVASGVRVVVGVLANLVPPALVMAGVAVIRAHGRGSNRAGARVIVGCALVLLAAAGLANSVADVDGFADTQRLREGGGIVGAALGEPLEAGLGPIGAVVALIGGGLVGVILVGGVRLWRLMVAFGALAKKVGASCARAVTRLFELGDAPDGRPPAEVVSLPDGPFPMVGIDAGDTSEVSGGSPDIAIDGDRDTSPPDVDASAGPGFASEAQSAESLPPTEAPGSGAVADAAARGGSGPREERVSRDTHSSRTNETSGQASEQLEIELPGGSKKGLWKLPSQRLLERSGGGKQDGTLAAERGRALERALAEHGVETRLVGMVIGPTVTRYELELGPGVKVSRVTSLHRDIAYAMASPDVRILAPIPGKQALGVEVPNAVRQIVTLGDLLASAEAKAARHPLEVALGRDINGRTVMLNLARLPHVLIAGATGAGKSSCINTIITSIAMRATPDQVRLILVDPKRVELSQYEDLPHLLMPVVTDPRKAANALQWAVKEMERRYELLSEVGVRDIDGYNSAYDRGDLEKFETRPADDEDWKPRHVRLPYVLVVVDELNDLMMVAARDVEESICRIAQMARAVGIHLVIATQRPSVNVITGVIKANIPARMAFAVSSLADSRVILDQAGAERLVGRGDMLLLDPSSSELRRVQAAWVSEREVRAVVAHWRRQEIDVERVEEEEIDSVGRSGDGEGDEEDDLLERAMELVVRSQHGSTSMLQRKLGIGFARAGRLMDLLEQRGVVGPSEGPKPRAVLIRPEELDRVRGST